MEAAEARFIFDSISALLRFVKSVEANKFEAAKASREQSVEDEFSF
jgi:hypothetical protein